MKRKRNFLRINQIIILLCLPLTTSLLTNDKKFLAEIYINECIQETWYIFPGPYPSPKYPSVIISMCHALPAYQSIINYKELSEVKSIARYSPHSFRLDFVHITSKMQVEIWQAIYERLIITSIQRENFHHKARTYNHDYPYYDETEFKFEFLRSRWNIDEISMYESHEAYALFKFGDEGHLPYSIERNMNRHKDISDLTLPLYFRIVSGKGHQCKHDTMLIKLKSLTSDFNAYDRLFCDAFDYYNVSFEGYWNKFDMVYHRAHFVRDDIMSSFPPEAKALYYASPMITFIVLQREPVTWTFIFRPFPKSLWASIIVAFFVLKGAQQLIHIDYMIYMTGSKEIESISFILQRRYHNAIEFTAGMFRTVIVSAYAGMILLGILYPDYTWTPDVFQELNRTTNYKICTSKHLPIKDTHLKENFILNGVPNDNWELLTKLIPAEYFATEEEADSSKETVSPEGQQYFKAALMYDDKMNLWMKGRESLQLIYSVFDKIKLAKDKVLSEIRYVSIAAGATRLHFLMDAMKWGFTCGVWMRYYNLENNYYKNVAPLIVQRMKLEERSSVKNSRLHEKSEENKRPLTWKDVYSTFVLNGIGLVIAGLVWLLELYYFLMRV